MEARPEDEQEVNAVSVPRNGRNQLKLERLYLTIFWTELGLGHWGYIFVPFELAYTSLMVTSI